jgi:site-specific recombinase XerD
MEVKMNSVLELGNLIQGFELSCRTEGKSPRTTEWYISFLKRFLHVLEINNHPTDIIKIDKNHVRAFILYLQQEAKTPYTGKQLSHSTIQGYVRTLKAFFSWAIREEYIESNPMIKIPVPKAPIKVVPTCGCHADIMSQWRRCRNCYQSKRSDRIRFLSVEATGMRGTILTFVQSRFIQQEVIR